MQKILTKIIYGGIILTAFVPLTRGYAFFWPLEFGKAAVLKIIIEILIALYLILLTLNREWLPWKRRKFSLIEWSVFGFLTVLLITTLFSSDPRLSFWGEPQRAGGVFTLIHYFLLFVLALIFINDDKKWQSVWKFAIAAAAIVGIIAIEQKFNFLNIPLLLHYERPAATIGNVNFLAAYLLLFVFPTISFALRKFKNFKDRSMSDGGLKPRLINFSGAGFYFLAAGIQIIAIIATASRGAFVGLIAGAFIFIFAFPTKEYRKKAFAAAALIGLIASFFIIFRTDADGIFQRMSKISPGEHTTQTRLLIWQISSRAFKEKPILGWGPENFSVGFDKYFNPELSKWGETEAWQDRAHNFIFDVGVTSGIVGLAAYLAIFAAAFYKISQKKKNVIARRSPQATDEAISRGLPRSPYGSLAMTNSELFLLVGLQSTWTAYLVQNLFNFDTVSTYIISFLLLAYTVYVVRDTNNEVVIARRSPQATDEAISRGLPRSPYGSLTMTIRMALKIMVAIVIIFFISKLIFFTNLRPFLTNYEVNRLIELAQTGYPGQALAQFDELSRAKTPYDHYFYLLKQSPWEFAYAKTLKDVDLKKSEEIVLETIERVKKYGRLRPHYTRNYAFLAELYDFLIQQGRPEFQKDKDEALRKAKELSPFRY